jgi:hypothetical protein
LTVIEKAELCEHREGSLSRVSDIAFETENRFTHQSPFVPLRGARTGAGRNSSSVHYQLELNLLQVKEIERSILKGASRDDRHRPLSKTSFSFPQAL